MLFTTTLAKYRRELKEQFNGHWNWRVFLRFCQSTFWNSHKFLWNEPRVVHRFFEFHRNSLKKFGLLMKTPFRIELLYTWRISLENHMHHIVVHSQHPITLRFLTNFFLTQRDFEKLFYSIRSHLRNFVDWPFVLCSFLSNPFFLKPNPNWIWSTQVLNRCRERVLQRAFVHFVF